MAKRRWMFLPLGLLLAGCFTPIVPGESREAELYERFGQPDERREASDGSRVLVYPGGPLGTQSWRFTVSPEGIVERIEQLLDEAHFARIRAPMTRDEVRRELGRPGESMRFANLQEEVWSWRYLDFGNRRMFFNVHFDPQGRVKYTSRSEEELPAALRLRVRGR
jgi:hypothetical protein